VTSPIRYNKHKNSTGVYVILVAMTWIISVAISSPIALGGNYTKRRQDTPDLCTFYNSDFLIYSSMGSFYIPCIVMLALYWKMFRSIRQMARRSVKIEQRSAFSSWEIDEVNVSAGIIRLFIVIFFKLYTALESKGWREKAILFIAKKSSHFREAYIGRIR